VASTALPRVHLPIQGSWPRNRERPGTPRAAGGIVRGARSVYSNRPPAGNPASVTHRTPVSGCREGVALFRFSGVGRYLVVRGSTITIEPDEPADAAELRAWLYGLVMGMACLQRGLLPLHASAVAFGERVVAFSGDSGAGKSTLAVHCLDKGAKLVTDDLLVLSFDARGHVVVNPGTRRLKLWRDALERLGRPVDELAPDLFREDKYYLPAQDQPGGALRLAAICILKNDAQAGIGTMARISGAEVLKLLVSNTFLPEFLDAPGIRRLHFGNCVQLAARVPLFWLARQRDPRWLRDTVQLLSEQALILDPGEALGHSETSKHRRNELLSS
jgi:hypothetical protein